MFGDFRLFLKLSHFPGDIFVWKLPKLLAKEAANRATGIDMWLLRDGRRNEGTSPGINRFPLLQPSGIFLFSSPPRISGEEKEVPTLLSVDRPCGKRQQPSTFGIERETHVSRLFCCWHSKAPRASVDIFFLFLSPANVKLGSVSLFQ